MQAIPLVRSSSVRPLLDFLEQLGAKPGPMLASAHDLLRDPTALLPVATAGALVAEAERASGREDLGFRAGAATRILELGEWGRLIAEAETVAGLIATMVTNGRRFNTGEQFWAVQRGNEIWLHHHLSARLAQGRRPAAEFSLMLILQALRLATGSGWRPREIHLESAAPSHASELAALAEKRISFDQPYTALVFPVRTLARRFPPILLPPRPAAVAQVPAHSFEGSVRQMVESLLRLGTIDLAVAAEAAQMSERSFQRRLTQCGLSFTRLVDEARFESARRLLGNPAAKIVEISAELGYTDSANFTRAFRRWSGQSPQAFRKTG